MTMPKASLVFVLACFLVSCGVDIPLSESTRAPVGASWTPRVVIKTPAPAFATASPSATSSPTRTVTPTPTVSPTPTPELPVLEISILGCDTSIDLAHQMGEVTNAYVIVANTGQSAASNVCALLSASDEGRSHPDKTVCIASLPPRTRVTFKLTVDTEFGQDSRIQVDVTSAEKVSANLMGGSCRAIGAPTQLDPFGVVRPIP
jgi:hypothetical protein